MLGEQIHHRQEGGEPAIDHAGDHVELVHVRGWTALSDARPHEGVMIDVLVLPAQQVQPSGQDAGPGRHGGVDSVGFRPVGDHCIVNQRLVVVPRPAFSGGVALLLEYV